MITIKIREEAIIKLNFFLFYAVAANLNAETLLLMGE